MHIPIPLSAKSDAEAVLAVPGEWDARYVSRPVRRVVSRRTQSVALVKRDKRELVDSRI